MHRGPAPVATVLACLLAAAAPAGPLDDLAFSLVNAERAGRNLAPLAADPVLGAVARGQAAEMRDLGFVGHISPRGHRTTGARLALAGVSDASVAENVGCYASNRRGAGWKNLVRGLHDRLMQSPVHRANILNPAFNRAGIGVVTGTAASEEASEIPLPAVWIAEEFVNRRLVIARTAATLTVDGLEVRMYGTLPRPGTVLLRVRPRTGGISERTVAAPDGAFEIAFVLPPGTGRYEAQLCIGSGSNTPANAFTIDSGAPPPDAVAALGPAE